MLYGPIGGTGGDGFNKPITASNTRISRITAREKNVVDALGFTELNKITGETTSHGLWGGDGGEERRLDLEDWHYIYGISGEYGKCIDYLQFYIWNAATQTAELTFNVGTSKPHLAKFSLIFGPEPSKPPKEVYGFAGRAKACLDAIGIYVRDR